MTNQAIQQKLFKNLLEKLEIKQTTEKERFNEWMKKIKNIYYSDNEKMCKAYERIIEFNN